MPSGELVPDNAARKTIPPRSQRCSRQPYALIPGTVMSDKPFRSWKLYLFAVLSAADFVMTWWLLRHGDGVVYESNPVANWWLGRFGWTGLAGFKGAVALLALTLFSVIA